MLDKHEMTIASDSVSDRREPKKRRPPVRRSISQNKKIGKEIKKTSAVLCFQCEGVHHRVPVLDFRSDKKGSSRHIAKEHLRQKTKKRKN